MLCKLELLLLFVLVKIEPVTLRLNQRSNLCAKHVKVWIRSLNSKNILSKSY